MRGLGGVDGAGRHWVYSGSLEHKQWRTGLAKTKQQSELWTRGRPGAGGHGLKLGHMEH